MGWGTSWGIPKVEQDKLEHDVTFHGQTFMKDGKNIPLSEVFVDNFTTVEIAKAEKLDVKILKDIQNKIPTHDPYTNPNAFLYYECECGQRLDPRVKSFARLNNHASDAGWKVRWGPYHYVPYCPKCVEEKGIE